MMEVLRWVLLVLLIMFIVGINIYTSRHPLPTPSHIPPNYRSH
jgi:hypothetical protein